MGLALLASEAAAQPRDSVFEMLEAERRTTQALSVGAGMTLTQTPQLGVHWEVSRGWMIGCEMRSWILNAEKPQDQWPEIGLHFRKLWLAPEDRFALKNSEYLEAAIGLFPAYNFGSTAQEDDNPFITADALGYRPMLRLAIGKYWMPFSNLPLGLDANLVLGRYLEGHPPLFPHQDLLTVTLSVFWVPNRRNPAPSE